MIKKSLLVLGLFLLLLPICYGDFQYYNEDAIIMGIKPVPCSFIANQYQDFYTAISLHSIKYPEPTLDDETEIEIVDQYENWEKLERAFMYTIRNWRSIIDADFGSKLRASLKQNKKDCAAVSTYEEPYEYVLGYMSDTSLTGHSVEEIHEIMGLDELLEEPYFNYNLAEWNDWLKRAEAKIGGIPTPFRIKSVNVDCNGDGRIEKRLEIPDDVKASWVYEQQLSFTCAFDNEATYEVQVTVCFKKNPDYARVQGYTGYQTYQNPSASWALLKDALGDCSDTATDVCCHKIQLQVQYIPGSYIDPITGENLSVGIINDTEFTNFNESSETEPTINPSLFNNTLVGPGTGSPSGDFEEEKMLVFEAELRAEDTKLDVTDTILNAEEFVFSLFLIGFYAFEFFVVIFVFVKWIPSVFRGFTTMLRKATQVGGVRR